MKNCFKVSRSTSDMCFFTLCYGGKTYRRTAFCLAALSCKARTLSTSIPLLEGEIEMILGSFIELQVSPQSASVAKDL